VVGLTDEPRKLSELSGDQARSLSRPGCGGIVMQVGEDGDSTASRVGREAGGS